MKSTTAPNRLGGPLLPGELLVARIFSREENRVHEHWIAGELAAEWALGFEEPAELEREARS